MVSPSNSRRAGWARLPQKIFEVDPLLCPRCRVPLELVSVITEPKVVDRILAHRRKNPAEGRDLFPVRASPGETLFRQIAMPKNRRNRIHRIAKSRLSRSGMRQENPFHSIDEDRADTITYQFFS